MNTLTIPQLDLFNSKRNSPKKASTFSKIQLEHTLDLNKQYLTRHLHRNFRDGSEIFAKSIRGFSSQKPIDYLQKRTIPPCYYDDLIPQIYGNPYLPYPRDIPLYFGRNSLGKSQKDPCQCEIHIPQRDTTNNRALHSNFSHTSKQTFIRNQPKIIKQPYLQPTFRQGRGFISSYQTSNLSQNDTKKINKNVSNSTNIVRDQMIISSKIMQKLITQQSNHDQQPAKIIPIIKKHETSIQTQKQQNQSNLNSRRESSNNMSFTKLQRILQEQKVMIESLNLQSQRDNDYKFDVQDLQTTRNEYIDRSRDILLKLNQLANQEKQFGLGLIFKATSDKRKVNVFSGLQL